MEKVDAVRLVANAGLDAMGRMIDELEADSSVLLSAIFTNALGTVVMLRRHGADISAVKEIVGRIMLACEDNEAPTPPEKVF